MVSLNVLFIGEACEMKITLDRLNVLFIDCQTTGANPDKGNILEIGWARSDNCSCDDLFSKRIQTCLVKQPDGQEIPKRVQTVTGICQEDLSTGHDVYDVWKKILACAEDVARMNQMEKCLSIIHFSRFEEPFLRNLHQQCVSDKDFPLRIICTHEIARRLFPGLPRRGIRAITGYLGHSVPEYRRCRDHIVATAHIWQEVVRIMKEQHDITTLEELQQWLDNTTVRLHSERVYPMKVRMRRNLPDSPGIYRMLRSNGDVLYVGKARSLRKRVNSYFKKKGHHQEHILEMLSQAKQLDVTKTTSALEAAVLESDEIKLHSPPYNIALRKRKREVWFCSADFMEFSHTPDRRCRIGPLTSQEPLKRLFAIRQVIQTSSTANVDEDLLLAGLGIPVEYAPDTDCIRDGFDTFMQKHMQQLNIDSIEPTIGVLGKEFWLRRLAEKNGTDSDESYENDLESDEKVHVWTPESVSHALESNVRRGTHEIRRARWLVLLTESSLAWEETESSKYQRMLLVFEKGRVVHRRSIDTEEEIPVPPGYRKKFVERQRSFDLLTIDRMKVLTTEIRRVVSSGHWLNLRLRPTVVLDRNKLTMIFKWI